MSQAASLPSSNGGQAYHGQAHHCQHRPHQSLQKPRSDQREESFPIWGAANWGRVRPDTAIGALSSLSRHGEPLGSCGRNPTSTTDRQGIRGANYGSQCPLTPPDSPRPPGANLQEEAPRPTPSDRPRHPIRAWGSRGRRFKSGRPDQRCRCRGHFASRRDGRGAGSAVARRRC